MEQEILENQISKNTVGSKNTFFDLIPQVFFDFIARIIPGPIILISFMYVFRYNIINLKWDFTKLKDTPLWNTFIAFILLLFVFYVVSVIFYGLWSVCCNGISRIYKKKKMHFNEAADAGDLFSIQHDYVKLYNVSAGSRITKLKAEIHMSGSLIMAFSICSFIEFYYHIYYGEYSFLIYIVCAIGAFCSNYHFCNRLLKSVESYSFLLKFKLERFDDFENYIKEIKKRETTSLNKIDPGFPKNTVEEDSGNINSNSILVK